MTGPGGAPVGLADRLAVLGGELELVSPAGAGTTVSASIPLARRLTPSAIT